MGLVSLCFNLHNPLYFTRETTYKAWRKFALVALPILILGIYATPQNGSSGFIGIGLEDRESFTMFGSAVFIVISYILIIYKSIKK